MYSVHCALCSLHCTLYAAVGDVEVTRQFLATNKRIINRGDSFKRRDGRALPSTPEHKQSPPVTGTHQSSPPHQSTSRDQHPQVLTSPPLHTRAQAETTSHRYSPALPSIPEHKQRPPVTGTHQPSSLKSSPLYDPCILYISPIR